MKMKGKNREIGFGICVLLLLAIMPVSALAVPSVINYQGYLTDAQGNPVDGNVLITFRIWDAQEQGTVLWTETHAVVSVSEGVFNVLLGSSVPISTQILNGDRYLGVTVGIEAEMTPRMKVTSAAYAIRAGYAESVAVGSVDTSALSDTAVTEAKIASEAISSEKIATGAVTGAKVAAGTVTASHLQNGAAITEISDNDGVGSGLDADLLDGQHASSFSLAGHDHDGTYVNATGDTMSATSSGSLLGVTNTGTGSGGYFSASGISGVGLYGQATNTGVGTTNYGGHFSAYGTSGRGVYGNASGAYGRGVYGFAGNSGNAVNYGGYFEAWGTQGRGVYGHAANTNTGEETNYGGYFSSAGLNGVGVYGEATNTGDGNNYGGYFTASRGCGIVGSISGIAGMGVMGLATNTGNGSSYAGYFENSGAYGYGVFTLATYRGGHFAVRGTNAIGVSGFANNDYGKGVYGMATGEGGKGVYGEGKAYDFYAVGDGINYGPFTGGHEVKLSEDLPEDTKPGMIVSVTGQAQLRHKEDGTPSLSSTLPTVKLSSKAADKAVLGVLVAKMPLPKDHWYEAKEGERFATVNALGEGRVWVSNINGDVEVGDYLTTSLIPGYGQRQDDDLLHSYTLGKAIEAVDWASVQETVLVEGREIKVYLIAVTYTSG